MVAFLYEILYILPLGILALAQVAPYVNNLTFGVGTILLTILLICVCTGYQYFKSREKALVPFGFFLAFFCVIFAQKPEQRWEFVLEHLWIGWLILLLFLCVLFGRVLMKKKIIRRIVAVAFIGELVWLLIWAETPEKLQVLMILFLLLVFLTEEVQDSWKKAGYTDSKSHLVYISPFFLAPFLLLFFLPFPKEPYDWAFAVKLWERASQGIRLAGDFFHGSGEDYDNLMIGFSDRGKLLGNFQDSQKEIMTLTGSNTVGPVVYLAGKTFDSFDGREWTAQNESRGNDCLLDTLETLCAVTAYDGDYVSDYLKSVNLKVHYHTFRTKYFFLPRKVLLLEELLGWKEYEQQGADVVSPKRLGFGTEYPVSYYRMNIDQERFQNFLRTFQSFDQNLWNRVIEKNGLAEREDCNYSEYLLHHQQIYNDYCPKTQLSQQLETYLMEYLSPCETNFDRLSALETLLSSYTYTDTPGEFPDTIEDPEAFLDYFMLQKKEGYCSYYATAFVLLARSLGIPARYVQGYYVPKNNDEEIVVTSNMAHAWPEAYLEGVGWIPFEPTPQYKRKSLWKLAQRDKTLNDEESREASLEAFRKLLEQETAMETEEIVEETQQKIPWQRILLLIAFGIGCILLFFGIDRRMTKKWYENLTDDQKFRVSCLRNLRICQMLGFPVKMGESLEEFGIRLEEGLQKKYEISSLDTLNMIRFIVCYEEVIYGGREGDTQMRKMSEESYEKLMGLLHRSKGRRYFWYRIQIENKKITKQG